MTKFPEQLLNGYSDFRAGIFPRERERYTQLAKNGQAPNVMMITCCDSRAAPETIFSACPGEIFVARNVANLVQPHDPDQVLCATSASLEFAVQVLKVKNMIVMGHKHCGGVAASLEPNAQPLSRDDFTGKWIKQLRLLAKQLLQDSTLTNEERQIALEHISVRQSVRNLRTFPFIAEREACGELFVHGAWFDISNGELWTMNPDRENFEKAPIKTANTRNT